MSSEYRTTTSWHKPGGEESTVSKPLENEDAHPTEEGSHGIATSTEMESKNIFNSTLAALENAQHGETAARLRKNWDQNVTFVKDNLDVLQADQWTSLVCTHVDDLADVQNLTFQGEQGERFVLTTDKAGTLTHAETCLTDLGTKGSRGRGVAWWL